MAKSQRIGRVLLVSGILISWLDYTMMSLCSFGKPGFPDQVVNDLPMAIELTVPYEAGKVLRP